MNQIKTISNLLIQLNDCIIQMNSIILEMNNVIRQSNNNEFNRMPSVSPFLASLFPRCARLYYLRNCDNNNVFVNFCATWRT